MELALPKFDGDDSDDDHSCRSLLIVAQALHFSEY